MQYPTRPPIAMIPIPPPPATRPARAQVLGLLAIAAGILIVVGAAPARPTTPGAASIAPGIFPTVGSGRVPVSVEHLHGAWFMPALADGSVTPVIARFSADGSFVLGGVRDDRGGLEDSWSTGDFQVRPTGITFHPTGGWCGATENFAWHVTISPEGRMQALQLGSTGPDRDKIGHCTVLVGATFELSRVSPWSPAAAGVTGEYLKPDRPIRARDATHLDGYWLVAGSGLLMQVRRGAYVMDGGGELGTGALDAGTMTVADGRLRLVSGTAATGCPAGTEVRITGARIEAGGLRGTVADDTCNRGLPASIELLHLDPTRP